MKTHEIFVDTSFFKAIADPKDDFHEDALNIFDRLTEEKTTLITSNFILDETYTLIRKRCGIEKVRQFTLALEEFEIGLEIIRVKPIDEQKAWDWFWKDWSGLSFTDCVSFALMQRLGLTRVATFDTHFSKAGFAVEK